MFESVSYGSISAYRKAGILLLASCLLTPTLAMAKNVLISTSLGDIEIELLEDDAPQTVANFLNYIDNNLYDSTFVHRSVPDFVVQGGGFTFIDGQALAVESFPTIENEFKISNTRGTVAMAKLGGDPDSATSQWFINVTDNADSLDDNNGGFTVFARVVGDGMDIVDAINALPRVNANGAGGGPFGELPVIDLESNTPILEENLVMNVITELPTQAPFAMNAGLNDAWFDPATDGQGFFITVFPGLNFVSLAWFTYDTELPADGESANLGDPGHRWLTAAGVIEGNRAVMDITVTSGGLFDAASDIQRTNDGVIILTFGDCSTGLVEYDITSIDQQGSVPIQRVANDNIALCEALSEPEQN
jgi:cyclophilin family peptidyl-prolyl cis-trans isomerase